jgi:NhaP-type Na+/H+ and K+/H+ antiporter
MREKMGTRLRNIEAGIAASILVLTGLVATVEPAQAYVGPGMELGTLGAAFGMLMTGISAVFYMSTLWVRRLWQRVTGRAVRTTEIPAEASSGSRDP